MSTLKSKIISAPINGTTVESLVLQTNNTDRVTISSSGNVSTTENVTVGKAATIGTSLTVGTDAIVTGKLGVGGANYGTAGQVLTSGGDSAAPSWQNPAGMELLGTLTTTSGSTQTLSGLDLTPYDFLIISINNVSHSNTGASPPLRLNAVDLPNSGLPNTSSYWGVVSLDLNSGVFGFNGGITGSTTGTVSTNVQSSGGRTSVTNATTSLSFTWTTTSNFDAGSIRVYGVK